MITRLLRYFNLIDFLIVVGLTLIFGMIFHHFYLPLPIKYQEITISQPKFHIRYARGRNRHDYIVFIDRSPAQHRYVEICDDLDNGSYNLCNRSHFHEMVAINTVRALTKSNGLSGEESSVIIKALSFTDTSNTNHLFRVSQDHITEAMRHNHNGQLLLRFMIPVCYLGLLLYFFQCKIRDLFRKITKRPFRL